MARNLSLMAAAMAGLLIAGPAFAGIGVRLGTDVDLGVSVRVGEPYVYHGYHSGRWYPYEDPRRAHVYYDEYGGYDCYRAFQYTWYDGHRARYDAYWCFDEDGHDYEVRRTRAVVRID